MRNSLACLLLTVPLLAQPGPVPEQAPIDALIQRYQSAFKSAHYDDAACLRDEARGLFAQISATDPQFVNWALRVSRLYGDVGLTAQAREVLEQSLVKSGGLNDSAPVRVALLSALSSAWEEDRNLLKATAYREQAVSAAEAGPGGVDAALADSSLYLPLIALYLDIGRPQEAAQLQSRITAHRKNTGGPQAFPTMPHQPVTGKTPELFHLTYPNLLDWAGARSSAQNGHLLQAQRSYPSLIADQESWSGFEDSANNFRNLLTTAHGVQTGWLEDYLRLRIESEIAFARQAEALRDARELMRLEDSLSGSASEPFLRASETLAITLEAGQNYAAAVPIRRQVVALADLVYAANTPRQVEVRVNAARTFADQQEFDEAIRLLREAVTIVQSNNLPDAAFFQDLVDQALQMKQASQSTSAALK